MSAEPLVTDEELVAWQEGRIEWMKRWLQDKDRVQPGLLFILTTRSRVSDDLNLHLGGDWKIALTPKGQPTPISFAAIPEEEVVELLIPGWFHSNLAELWAIRELVVPEQPLATQFKLRQVIAVMVEAAELAPGMEMEEKYRIVVKVLKERIGVSDKGLWARYLRFLIKASGALAVCKVDEGYVLKREGASVREDHPDDLSNYEGASETLMVHLETPRFVRYVSMPFKRSKRNTGKFEGFTEEPTIMDTREPDRGVEGRFTNLFSPLPDSGVGRVGQVPKAG